MTVEGETCCISPNGQSILIKIRTEHENHGIFEYKGGVFDKGPVVGAIPSGYGVMMLVSKRPERSTLCTTSVLSRFISIEKNATEIVYTVYYEDLLTSAGN